MSVQTFTEEYMSLTWQNPFNNRERVLNGETVAFNVTASSWMPETVSLNTIRSFSRGNGEGSKGLRWILSLAEKHSVRVAVTIEPFGTTKPRLSRRQLTSWYRRYGFQIFRGGHGVYYPETLKSHGG